jgi:hypothetical protein
MYKIFDSFKTHHKSKTNVLVVTSGWRFARPKRQTLHRRWGKKNEHRLRGIVFAAESN